MIQKFVVFVSPKMLSFSKINISSNNILILLIVHQLCPSLIFRKAIHLLSLILNLCITGGAMRHLQNILLPIPHQHLAQLKVLLCVDQLEFPNLPIHMVSLILDGNLVFYFYTTFILSGCATRLLENGYVG